MLAWCAEKPAKIINGRMKQSAAEFARTTALRLKTSHDRAVIATINAVLTRLSLVAPANMMIRSPTNPLCLVS